MKITKKTYYNLDLWIKLLNIINWINNGKLKILSILGLSMWNNYVVNIYKMIHILFKLSELLIKWHNLLKIKSKVSKKIICFFKVT